MSNYILWKSRRIVQPHIQQHDTLVWTSLCATSFPSEHINKHIKHIKAKLFHVLKIVWHYRAAPKYTPPRDVIIAANW